MNDAVDALSREFLSALLGSIQLRLRDGAVAGFVLGRGVSGNAGKAYQSGSGHQQDTRNAPHAARCLHRTGYEYACPSRHTFLHPVPIKAHARHFIRICPRGDERPSRPTNAQHMGKVKAMFHTI